MTVLFTRQTHEKTARLRRAFKHDKVTRRFLIHLYRKGYLKRLSKIYPLARIAKGKLPRRFDIHHIVPLSGGGTNTLSNLCLIEQSLHKFINRRCFDPALKNIKEGETVEVNVPNFGPVALHKDYTTFINETLRKTNRESGFRRLVMKPLARLPRFFDWRK